MATYYVPNSDGWKATWYGGSNNPDLWLRLRIDQDYTDSSNTSKLQISMEIYPTRSGQYFIYSTGSAISTLTLPGAETYEFSNREMRVDQATANAWNTLDSSDGPYWERSISHANDGTLVIDMGFSGYIYSSASGGTANILNKTGSADISQSRAYKLNIKQPTGAVLTVKRTGATVPNGATVYYGDVLTVTASAATGYGDPTLSVSGATKSGNNYTVTGDVTVSATAGAILSYTLTISQGTGSSISVQRTSSPIKGAATGNLANGSTVYYNDVLKISFGASSGYTLSTHTVNGSTFTSGSNHTVTGAVSVVSRATLNTYTLSIAQGANTTITVTRGTETLKNGAKLTHGDKLSVSFTVGTGYSLKIRQVNGTTRASGYQFTVTSAVSVVTEATALSYTLSISTGAGSSVTVTRSSSPKGGASTGNLANGAKIYYSDVLKISFGASSGYTLSTHTVNGSTFTSGSNHTVTGAVSVSATANVRPSTVSVNSITIGEANTLNITAYNSSWTHTVVSNCLGVAETIAEKSSASKLQWSPAVATYAPKLPNAMSTTVTFTVTTYNGNTQIGVSTLAVTANLRAADVKPSVSFEITDTTDAYATFGAYVQGISKLKITATDTLRYGATVKSRTIKANGATYSSSPVTTSALADSGAQTVKASFTDSRGQTTITASKTITVMEYSSPRVSQLTVRRCDSNGNASEDGSYMLIAYTVEVSPLNSKNSKSLLLRYKPVASASWTRQNVEVSAYTETGRLVIPADVDKSYDVRLDLSDYYSTSARRTSLSAGSVFPLNFQAGGKGIGIGKISETEKSIEINGEWSIFHGTAKLSDPLITVQTFTVDAVTVETHTTVEMSVPITVPNGYSFGAAVQVWVTGSGSTNAAAIIGGPRYTDGVVRFGVYNLSASNTREWKPYACVMFIRN